MLTIETAETAADFPSLTTHNGTLTVHNPETGNHRTFRVKTQKDDARFAPGKRVVSMLTGPETYTGFGFVENGRIYTWRSKTQFEKYARLLNNLNRAAERHNLRVGWARTCRRCNRQLTTPESIQSGIGPVCAERES